MVQKTSGSSFLLFTSSCQLLELVFERFKSSFELLNQFLISLAWGIFDVLMIQFIQLAIQPRLVIFRIKISCIGHIIVTGFDTKADQWFNSRHSYQEVGVTCQFHYKGTWLVSANPLMILPKVTLTKCFLCLLLQSIGLPACRVSQSINSLEACSHWFNVVTNSWNEILEGFFTTMIAKRWIIKKVRGEIHNNTIAYSMLPGTYLSMLHHELSHADQSCYHLWQPWEDTPNLHPGAAQQVQPIELHVHWMYRGWWSITAYRHDKVIILPIGKLIVAGKPFQSCITDMIIFNSGHGSDSPQCHWVFFILKHMG